MAKLPTAARFLVVPMVVVVSVALINDLGKYHWFWPYDRTIFSIAILIGVLWYVFFGAQVEAWAKEERAKRDRGDDGIQ